MCHSSIRRCLELLDTAGSDNNLKTMIILGIHDGHCASAALIIDNKLVAAISEERIVRKKMEWCFPEPDKKNKYKYNLLWFPFDYIDYDEFSI